MPTETNKALVRRFYEEIDKGNLDAMDGEATPGYHRIEDQIAEADKVVTRLTSFGKHQGDLPGAPRTGNDMEMTSITIHRIAGGKLVEKWSEKDTIRLLRQIGKMPPP
jgi:predicted ester cyclase